MMERAIGILLILCAIATAYRGNMDAMVLSLSGAIGWFRAHYLKEELGKG